jgi:uncharacterized protein DUF4242
LLPVQRAPSVVGVKEWMVEQYLPGITAVELDEASARLVAAVSDLAARGAEIKLVGSTFVPEEDSCFCRFEASSSEVVQRACELARVPVARIHSVRSLPRVESKKKEETCAS